MTKGKAMVRKHNLPVIITGKYINISCLPKNMIYYEDDNEDIPAFDIDCDIDLIKACNIEANNQDNCA